MVLVFAESLVSNHMLDLSFLRKLGKNPKLIDDRNTDLPKDLEIAQWDTHSWYISLV